MLLNKLKFAIPVWFVWTVILLTLVPDIIRLAGYAPVIDSWQWKSFFYNTLEYASVITAFLIVIISFIDFRIKGDVSTPLVASTMFFSGTLDFVHIMAKEGLIMDSRMQLFNSVYTWSFSRCFNALMLLIGAGLFLINSDNLFKNVKMHNRKFLIYVLSLFLVITVTFITLVAGLDNQIIGFLKPYVYSRQLDIIPLFLYLISLTLIFPKFYSNHPSIFSQTLLLSLVPAISAQLHVVFGVAVPYDHFTMVGSYEKLLSYLVPFAGVAMNYLQTHYNEVRAISRFKAEVNQKQHINALLEGIMDVSASGIFVFESIYDAKNNIRDFRCIKFNNAAGWLINTHLSHGQLFTNIFKDDPEFFGEYVQLVQKGKAFDRELFCERVNKWFLVSNVKYKNGFLMTIFDITGSRKAEEQLRKREELLSQAEEVAGFGSWEYYPVSDKVILSDNMHRLMHIPQPGFDGQRDYLLSKIHPDDAERSKRLLAAAIANQSDYYNEFRMIRPDGSIGYYITTGKVINDDKTNEIKCVGITMDISSKVMESVKMRRHEILYRTFADNMPDTEVILFNDEFKIILAEGNSANPLFRQKHELLSQDVREVLASYHLPIDLDRSMKNNPVEKTVITFEYDLRYFRVHHSYIDDDERITGFDMLLFQDVTEIKKAELQLEARLKDLDRSNKELENFAYVASHDLQEPLRKITAFGDRLKSKYAESLPDEGVDYIKRMTDATVRMQRLITDLLAFSRISRMAEPFQQVELVDIIKDILSDIEIKVQASNAVIKVEDLPEIEGIPSQLHQLFQNLILNAIKFSKKDEHPQVNIRGEIIQSKSIGKKAGRKFIRITVEDKGIGFDQIYADRIFTLFQRLHGRHEYEGTGIGLALCKKIVEQHQGDIEARGREGTGAEFIVTLPFTQLRKVVKDENIEDKIIQ